MKHFISWCLIIALLCQTIVLVDAEETNPSNPNYSLGLQSYVGSDDDTYLRTNANYGYWRFIEDYESDIVAMEILNSIDVLIGCGTQPSVQKYTEVLVNIIATYDHDNASDIAEQRKNDNMKSALDYAMDITKIGADAIGLMTDMDKSTSDLEKWIVKAISGLSVLEGNIDNWLDALSDLEALVQNYSKYDLFLELIEKKAKGDLKTAAATLRTSMEKAMQLRLNTYNTILNDNFDNYTEFFFNDVFFDTLKLTNEYDNDVNFKTLVDCGSDFADKVKEFLNLNKAWDLGLAIGTLVGNVAVGGEDLINRLHELMALRDIGDVLCNALEEDESLYTFGKYDEAVGEHFFVLSEYLTGCRLRGEYCLYSIVAADAGLLSRFSIEKANDAYNWYINRSSLIIGIMHAMDTACEAILVPISDPNYEIGEVSEWYIYDENGALCSNYTLRITGKEKMHIGAIETDFVGPIEYSVTKPEPLSLELEAGYWYSVEIVDDINKDNSLFFTVAVNDSSDGLIELIEIETDFTAAYEDSFSSEKKLTSIVTYQDNKKAEEYHFSYNDNRLLTGYTRDSYSSEHEYHYSYAYTYNADGNLTQSREILSGYPCTEYYYNDEGKLTGWEFWEFSWSSGKAYTCEYNASGQRIRDISTSGKDETLYFYDDLGRLISVSSRWVYGDMSGTDEITMTYDEYGNLSKKEILSDSGLGFPSMQTFFYNYDHFPFVHVTVYSDGEVMYSCLDYTAMPADEGISFTIDNTAKFEGEDGYLVKVIGEDCEWNFSYEQGNNLPVLDVSDSENQAGEANTSLRVIREASVGDYVTYGAYEQDNDLTNGQEPIEWLVLDREGDRVLLLSRYGLDAQPYNTVNMDVTWEKSSIRSWLNETFLRNAFSVEEQQPILRSSVNNSKSEGYYVCNTDGGDNTQDKIFLLSYSEANKYLGVTDSARENIKSQVLPTAYAKARGAYSGVYPPGCDNTDNAVVGWWWLRSPGFVQYTALCVNVGGSVSSTSEVGKTAGCIRPAFWISIE